MKDLRSHLFGCTYNMYSSFSCQNVCLHMRCYSNFVIWYDLLILILL